MKRIIFLIGLCIVFLDAKSQDSLKTSLNITFEEALNISVDNNLGIKETLKDEEIKKKELQAKKGLYMPNVSLLANYTLMEEAIEMDLNPLKEAIVPLYETLGAYGDFSGVVDPSSGATLPDDYATAYIRENLLAGAEEIAHQDWTEMIQEEKFGVVTLNAVYPIYAGGKIRSANKAAKIEVEEAQNETNIKKGEVTVELVERYYGLALAHEAQKVRQEVYDNMQTHLNNAERLKEEGMISNAEYLHAKVYFSEAERELKKAERVVEITNNAVLNTFSMAEHTSVLPTSELFFTPSIAPLDNYISRIPESDLLKKVEHKKQLAEVKHKVELGNMLPTVAAAGTYNVYDKDLSHFIPDYAVGVTVTMPIFEGGARYRELQASKMLNEKVDVIHNKVEKDLEMAVIKYHQEMNMYIEEIEELETSQQFADEYYRIRQKAFNEGMATAAEVSDASLALAKVKIDRFQAMYNFDVALAKTLYYSGSINEFLIYTK